MKRCPARLSASLAALGIAVLHWSTSAQAQEPDRPGIEPGEAQIHGTVTDLGTGAPLSGASVHLVRLGGEGSRFVLTTEDGRFRFTSIRAEEYRIEISFLGFRTVELDIRPEARDRTDVAVAMAPTAVQLDPIVVTSRRRTYLQRVGFHDRRDRGLGRFVTRQEIEDWNPFNVSDLFWRIPGFQVRPTGRGSTAQVIGRGGCVPTIYLDGMRLAAVGSIDEILLPHDLEALEVYSSAQAPPQFQGNRCGSVVAWTRVPDPGVGRGSIWRRFLVAVGFLGLAYFATN